MFRSVKMRPTNVYSQEEIISSEVVDITKGDISASSRSLLTIQLSMKILLLLLLLIACVHLLIVYNGESGDDR